MTLSEDNAPQFELVVENAPAEAPIPEDQEDDSDGPED